MTVGCRWRAGAAWMARNASSDSLRATATRSYSGDVPAASLCPKCRYTSPSVRPRRTGTALRTGGPGIPTTLAVGVASGCRHNARLSHPQSESGPREAFLTVEHAGRPEHTPDVEGV